MTMAQLKTAIASDIQYGVEVAKAAASNNGGYALQNPENIAALIEKVAFTCVRLRTGREPGTE